MKSKIALLFSSVFYLLVLVSCSNICNHEYSDYVIIENSTCTESGIKTRTCNLCGKSDEEVINPLGHDYNESWSWTTDYKEAKVELVCNTDPSHKSETVVTSRYEETPATCQKIGKKAYIAEVEIEGKVYTDVKSTIIPKIEHNFVNGICCFCSYIEGSCDHTELQDVVIDMGEFGLCDGYLSYKSCFCGEEQHTIIDMNLLVYNSDTEDFLIGLGCFDHMDDIESWSIEGTNHSELYEKLVCEECGLIYESLVIAENIDCCNFIIDSRFNLYKDDELLFELNFHDEEPLYWHTASTYSNDYINLSDYECCGGAIVLSLCDACDGLVDIEDIFLNCAKDTSLDEMTEKRSYEQDGYQCQEEIINCNKCGLSVVTKTKVSLDCNSEETMTISVKLDDEIIYEATTKEMYSDHDFSIDSEDIIVELNGDTCDDGYKVIIPCSNCDESYYFYGKGHLSEYTENVLGNYTCAGSTYSGECCIICGVKTDVYSVDLNCFLSLKSTTEYIDEYKNVHTVKTYNCLTCGLEKVVDNYFTFDDCVAVSHEEETYSINGVELFTLTDNSFVNLHSYETSLERLGNTCEEGIEITITCSNCDFVENYISYNHQYYRDSYYNNNICGSQIYYDKCECCDEIFDAYDFDHTWLETSSTVDNANNYQKTIKYTCENCALEKIEVYDYILQSNETCIYKESLKVTFIYNGVEIIKDAIKTYRMANNFPVALHNFGETVLIPIGNGGEYLVVRNCITCCKKDVYIDNKCNLFGHEWNDGEIITEASYDKEGEITYSCKNCDEHKYEILPKIEVAEAEIYEIDGVKYVNYGLYPQTLVVNEDLIEELNKLIIVNDKGYYEYDGEQYEKYNENYYLVEPIKWKIICVEENKILVISEKALDIQYYSKKAYYEKYDNSYIREWLNSDFLNKAFKDQSLINVTSVDNSAYSTGESDNDLLCDTTYDKIFILSKVEYSNSNYGFINNNDRIIISTDYEKAKIYDYWLDNPSKPSRLINMVWTRSPLIKYGTICCVWDDGDLRSIDGAIMDNSMYLGVCPAFWLTVEE